MQYLTYLIFRAGIILFSVIPFPLLYILSDMLSIVMYHLIGYRRNVTLMNLHHAFPEYSKEQIKKTARQSYKNLTDILLESLKGFTLSNRALFRRYVIKNPEALDGFYRNSQSVIGVTAHYANWEWGALAGGLQLRHQPVAFYKPLSNKYIDRYMRKNRARNGTLLKSIFKTTQTFSDHVNETSIFLMVADQSPSNSRKAYWVEFLGRQTACLHGPEKHARKNNLPVVYLDIQRVRRGFYQTEITPLVIEPAKEKDGAVTGKYMKQLESVIRKHPPNWLWTHKRWKKKPPHQE